MRQNHLQVGASLVDMMILVSLISIISIGALWYIGRKSACEKFYGTYDAMENPTQLYVRKIKLVGNTCVSQTTIPGFWATQVPIGGLW